MRVDDYLARLGCAAARAPSRANLRTLHRAHLERVPFENLDIHLGRPIVLDVPALLDKVVRRRRGGFCYELNGAFAWLLGELGYAVTLLSARVFGREQPGPEFDHMALLVEHEGRWLADVGFGESFLEPLALAPGREATEDGGTFWLEEHGGAWRVVRRREGETGPQFQFTLAPRRLGDFADMCRYQQTSPDSHFTRNVICSRALPHGRVTYSRGRLIVTERGERREEPVATAAELARVLRERFGVELGPEVDLARLLP